MRWFQLNLTSDDAPIYHSQRWDEAELAHEYSFRPSSRKTNFLSFISGLCYDPSVRRYYVQDGKAVRVFDSTWEILDSLDIGDIAPSFGKITRITSGELRGHLAGLNSFDNELIIINLEYDLAGDLITGLIGDIRSAGLKKGLANSLMQKLEDALDSLEKNTLGQPSIRSRNSSMKFALRAAKAFPRRRPKGG